MPLTEVAIKNAKPADKITRLFDGGGQLIVGDRLIDGTSTKEGLFFPIDGPLAFLNHYRLTREPREK